MRHRGLMALVLAAATGGTLAGQSLMMPAAAHAAATVSSGQAEAKEAAKSANCTPTKVEVLKYVPGRLQQTVFKIGCSENKDSFVVVSCRGRACAVMF